MSNQLKVLILGDGLLGSEIGKQTEWDYISRKKDGIDVLDFNTLIPYMDNFDTILNCIAFTKTYSEDKKSSWLINYKFVDELVEYCNKTNKKLFELAGNRAQIFNKRSESKVEDPIEVIRAKIEANDRKINYIDSQMDLVITHYKIKYFLGEI